MSKKYPIYFFIILLLGCSERSKFNESLDGSFVENEKNFNNTFLIRGAGGCLIRIDFDDTGGGIVKKGTTTSHLSDDFEYEITEVNEFKLQSEEFEIITFSLDSLKRNPEIDTLFKDDAFHWEIYSDGKKYSDLIGPTGKFTARIFGVFSKNNILVFENTCF